MSEVPVQFYQSVIAIELAIAGALLFQIRFFSPRDAADPDRDLPDPRTRLAMAVVLGTTVFGSLYAIKSGGRAADEAVTVGLAISLVPILLRALPHWAATRRRNGAIRTTPSPSSVWSCTAHSPRGQFSY